jgi:hypothetical protein
MKTRIKTYVVTGILLAFSFYLLPVNADDLFTADTTPRLYFDDTDEAGGNEWSVSGDENRFLLYNYDTGKNLIHFDDAADMQLIMINSLFGVGDSLGNPIVSVHSDAPWSLDIQSDGDVSLARDDVFIDASSNRLGIGTTIPANDLHIATSSPTIRLDDVEGRVWEINSSDLSYVFDFKDVTSGISPLTLIGGTGEVVLTGPFSVGSSREIKHGFATVEPREVLERLLKLEVSQWSYNSEDAAVRHMGPVAEDFGAIFALGTDDKHVSPADMSGVAFAAIQGLHQIVRERDAEISELRQSRDDFAARIETLEKLVSMQIKARTLPLTQTQ